MTWVIYVLKDPRSDEVRYVGKAVDPARRLYRHLYEKPRGDYRNVRWIKSLLADGVEPVMVIVENGTGDHAEAERKWIAEYRARGADLTNTARGGSGGNGPCTEEARRKIALSNTGKARSAETKERIRLSKLGKKQSDEHRLARSRGLKGHAVSIETRQKIGATKVGRPRPEATRAKIAAALKGRPLSEATRAKLRVSQAARRQREAAERAAERIEHGRSEEEDVAAAGLG